MAKTRKNEAVRKITVILPAGLIEDAQKATGEGLTSTIRQGLRLVAARRAYAGLRKLRGKIDLKLDLDALRADTR